MKRILLFSVILLSACSPQVKPGALQNAIPAAEAVLAPTTSMPYTMQVGDVLDVKFPLNPELDEQVIVRPDGRISTGLAQDVVAYGRTTGELREDLVEHYKQHLKEPHLSVIVRSYAPARIYVMGEVFQPGEFVSMDPNTTLLQALARAGGLRNSADMGTVLVIRRPDGDQPQIIRADYAAMVEQGDIAQDIRLTNRDVVFVPRTGIAETGMGYEQYVRQFINPFFGVGYQLNPND